MQLWVENVGKAPYHPASGLSKGIRLFSLGTRH